MGQARVCRIPSSRRRRTRDNSGRPDRGRSGTWLGLVSYFKRPVAFLKRSVDVRYSLFAVSGELCWSIFEFMLGFLEQWCMAASIRGWCWGAGLAAAGTGDGVAAAAATAGCGDLGWA